MKFASLGSYSAVIQSGSDRLRHAGVLKRPSIPPPAEVETKRYEYEPCPIDEPPMDSDVFMHYLSAPDTEHTEELFWTLRFPRRINESFLQNPGVGWGIQILEGPNWPLFWTFTTICTLLSGLIAGLFAWLKRDTASGVAIGAWLTAVQTMIVTTVFFRSQVADSRSNRSI